MRGIVSVIIFTPHLTARSSRSHISRAFCSPFFFSKQSVYPPSILFFFLAAISTSSESVLRLLPHFVFHPSIHPHSPLSSLAPFISASLTVCCHFFPLLLFILLLFSPTLFACLSLFLLWHFLSLSLCLSLSLILICLFPFQPLPNDPLLLFVCFYHFVCVCVRTCAA